MEMLLNHIKFRFYYFPYYIDLWIIKNKRKPSAILEKKIVKVTIKAEKGSTFHGSVDLVI